MSNIEISVRIRPRNEKEITSNDEEIWETLNSTNLKIRCERKLDIL